MYIGLSTNIEKRFSDHRNKAINSSKIDDRNKVLYKAMRKYGVDNFTYEIIEKCPKTLLKEREIFWIKYYNTYNFREHYNETPGGDFIGEKNVHRGEDHGMAILTEEEVIQCRIFYKKSYYSRNIYEKYFKNKIKYSSFQNMWHGSTWKHIMPEVFLINPHKGKMTAKDRDTIVERFKQSGLSLNKFSKTKECYVGYGTLYNMVHHPEFYNNK